MRFAAIVCVALVTGCSEHGSGGGGGDAAGALFCEGVRCAADEFCDFSRNGCGNLNADVGRCAKRPTTCDNNLEPVCGCDGKIHGNACDANASGTDVSAAGGCEVPAGRFECGFRQCTLVDEYCQRSFSDVGLEPDGFACLPFPRCPAQQDCMCLLGEPCGSFCTPRMDRGFELQCPGG
ncbi:MAG: hypothetical protein KF773_20640 [Deltaproteobacteria bacterium]|nr:hypothetical protein [Deltaproteobacteria bacterium]MCW5802727.1 hypothetical protein [Deltaproteobacteria bacterium]